MVGWSGIVSRYLSSSDLNSSVFLGVGFERYFGCLSSFGMMLNNSGALLKKELPLTVDTQVVVAEVGFYQFTFH